MPTAWFSVSDDTQVRFSHGNLQYQPSTGTWRFADRQYDLIGANNDQISSTSYTGWIDLFGWGTGNNPTCASEENNAYGDFTDWGTNPISNGGNAANQWRTLTNDEWEYLMLTRNTTSGIRFVKANVSLTNGLVILPDDWDASYYTLSNINNTSAYWTTNSISHDDWMSIFEAHGAIFLPAAGKRTGTSIYDTRGGGYYWSSSPHGNDYADYLFFSGSNLSMKYQSRYSGYSVRLVADE